MPRSYYSFLLTLLISVSLVALSTGCEDDEIITDNLDTSLLIGTWNLQKVEYKVLIATQEGDANGTITFNEDGTGKNDYTYTVQGSTQVKEDEFNWEADGASIIFDKGTQFENTWTWRVNTEETQEARFVDKDPSSGVEFEVTVTLSK